jgi:nucleoside-diphosphate-sugar epimerase
MTSTLVTGATGTLGAPTVTRLRAAGHDVRALSRRSGPGLMTGDLLTGAGLLRNSLTPESVRRGNGSTPDRAALR